MVNSALERLSCVTPFVLHVRCDLYLFTLFSISCMNCLVGIKYVNNLYYSFHWTKVAVKERLYTLMQRVHSDHKGSCRLLTGDTLIAAISCIITP
jgi:hypothetical protein